MNVDFSKNLRRFAFTGIFCCLTSLLPAQIVCSYDFSGNPTNSVLSMTTPLSSALTNSVQSVAFGGQLAFSVKAGGSGTITYQWFLNGVAITGATNATFFLANAGVANAGSYSVVVSNGSTSQTNQLGNVAVLGTTNALYAIAYGLNQFIAVGTNGTIVGSSNLVVWSTYSSGVTNSLEGIVFANNRFVAVGGGGVILTSTNGTAWSSQNSGVTSDLNGIAYGNGLFVAAGDGGVTLTSSTGIYWSQQTFSNPNLEGITYALGLFIAVGTEGAIWNSPDGTNWLGQNWSTTSTLNAVAYGNSQFIAVGAGGTILNSSDGTNWAVQLSSTYEDFTSILFFSGTFYALGPIGQNYISADGSNWGVNDAGTFTPLLGSTVGGSTPVAVGGSGLVMPIPNNVLDHFNWSVIASPQRINQPFTATVTAQDAAGNPVANFNGTVTLSAASSLPGTPNAILGNVVPEYTNSGSFTLGYAFTPNADLLVTEVRHYDIAQKVAIWAEDGILLASVNVTNNPGHWASNPMPVPLTLTAGQSYIVSVYTGDNTNVNLYYGEDGTNIFANGTIDQALSASGDAVPVYPQTAFWFLVDLGYTVTASQTNTVTPTTATFVNGVATLNPAVVVAGQSVTLTAADGAGHAGTSSPFNVYGTNDLAITLAASPNPVSVQSNLSYTITVMNSGPTAATGVTVTNRLPASVSFVSASSTQGTCQNSGGLVTCSVGTLANQTTATITIIATPTVAGLILTNTVNVAESGTDSNLTNNTATNLTYVPPTLSIGDAVAIETTTGITYTPVTITLSSPSALSIQFEVATADGSNAQAGRDYVPIAGTLYFPAGSTSTVANLSVGIQGSTIISPTKQFTIQLSNPLNATLAKSTGTVQILNPNGQTGQVYNLAWNSIPSPQRTNQPFAVSLTAQDANGNTATNFTGSASLVGINVNGPSANTLQPSPTPSASANTAIKTVGYAFMPTNDIYVTHVRAYAGTKVSLWTDTGFLLATQNVTSVAGTWVDTPLATPVWLQASNTYRLGVFTAGSTYYWRQDGARSFSDGLLTQGYSSGGDAFPTNSDGAQWYLVDLRYVRPANISPTNTGSFANGVWAGNLNIGELGTNFILFANDGNGHVGYSNPFGVYATNDLAVTIGISPTVPLATTNLSYIVTVLNPGPGSSTGVQVTNLLPSGATYISAVASQGTCSQAGGVVTASLGTIPALSNATVTITVLPTVAGLPLTNSVTVMRNESDGNLSNNSAISVVVPSSSLTSQLANALNYSATPWLSGGDALWFAESSQSHDGTNAGQSGAIIDSQQTWVQTTVYGPGTVSFWWSVSSQAGGDYLNFLTNGVVAASISGIIGWQQVTLPVCPGHTVLKWNYSKNGSISAGTDAGWLDQVSYTRTPLTLNSPVMKANGSFVFSVNGSTGQWLVLQNSTNLFQWTSLATNTMTGGVFNFTNTLTTNYPNQFYRVMDVTP